MASGKQQPVGDAGLDVIREALRLNGPLAASADALVADLAITGARYQVLAALAALPAPEPVGRLARLLGLSRQNVQRIVNELLIDRLVRLDDNPHHRRAKLVVPTPRGRRICEEAEKRQGPWANLLVTGITQDQIAAALHVLRTLRYRLEAD
jgi:DNA-binding MarR family transcriptional regulator